MSQNEDGKSYEDLLKESQEPSKDYSEASKSAISTPHEDNITEKRDAVLNLVNDVKTQREDIDKLNQSMEYVVKKMDQVITVVDAQSKILSSGKVEGQQTQQRNNLEMLNQFFNSSVGEKIASKFFPENSAPALISQEVINEKMQKAFMDDLDTGESIRKFISDSLKRKATKEIVNTSLGNIGKEVHEPK